MHLGCCLPVDLQCTTTPQGHSQCGWPCLSVQMAAVPKPAHVWRCPLQNPTFSRCPCGRGISGSRQQNPHWPGPTAAEASLPSELPCTGSVCLVECVSAIGHEQLGQPWMCLPMQGGCASYCRVSIFSCPFVDVCATLCASTRAQTVTGH